MLLAPPVRGRGWAGSSHDTSVHSPNNDDDDDDADAAAIDGGTDATQEALKLAAAAVPSTGLRDVTVITAATAPAETPRCRRSSRARELDASMPTRLRARWAVASSSP